MTVKDYDCCVDGCYRKASSWFNDKPYCNKHWLRMYTHGDTKLHGKRVKTKYRKHDGYAEGVTSKGVKFEFDLDDWNKVTKHSWSLSPTGYLVCTYKGKTVKLHRMIMNATHNGLIVDHVNGDTLDNRKKNLRITTQKNNARNTKLAKNNTSGVTGVSKLPNGRYKARIMVNYKNISLGVYHTMIGAVVARKKAERKYFGEYARK